MSEPNNELVVVPVVGRVFSSEDENVSFGESDARTYIRKTRLELGVGDATALQQYFNRMQQKNHDFYYIMDINDEGRLMNVFCADARNRAAYMEFCDVITFDSTYLTNKYNMPFAPFVGINHYGQSLLLGCALLSNEDTSTYIWLFKCWLECMSNCQPLGIVTYQYAAMKEAIFVVFPETTHRLCLWHIMRKIPAKLSEYDEYRLIKTQMKKVVYESLCVEDFEQKWTYLIEDFGLYDDTWLCSLYALRQSWVQVYLKNKLWAGTSTTQRSESMNAFFDEYVNSKTSLKQFVREYDNALKNKAEKENAADFACFHKNLPLVSDLHIEKQFAEVYTHEILKKFQVELKELCNCNVRLLSRDGSISIYEVVESVLAFDRISRKRIVMEVEINEHVETVECLCSLFNFKGIVCHHMIASMKFHGLNIIPDKYILRRWRKNIRHPHTLITCSEDDALQNPQMQRYTSLCKETNSANEIFYYSEEKTNWWRNYIRKGKEKCAKVVSSILGDISCTSAKAVGILSLHNRAKGE